MGLRMADLGVVALGACAVAFRAGARNRYLWALLTAGALLVLGTLLATARSGTVLADGQVLGQFLFAIIFIPWIMIAIVDSERRLLLALAALVASAVTASAFAVVAQVTDLWFLTFPEEANGVRAFGLSTDPGLFGLLAAEAIPVAVGIALVVAGPIRFTALAVLPLLVAGLVMSGSRAALVGAVVAAVVVAVAVTGLSWRRSLAALGLLAVMGAAAVAAFPQPVARLTGDTTFSDQARLEGYAQSWAVVRESPLVGQGASEVKPSAGADLATSEIRLQPAEVYPAHNLYLQTWVAIGLPGLLALLIVMGAAVAGVLRLWRAPRTTDRRYGWLLAAALLVAVAVQLSTPAVFERQVWLTVGLAMAAGANIGRSAWDKSLGYDPGATSCSSA